MCKLRVVKKKKKMKQFELISVTFDDIENILNIVFGAKNDWAALMQFLRLNVKNRNLASVSGTTGLFHNKGHWNAFVQQTELTTITNK